MAEEGSKISFKGVVLPVAFVVYADFEALTEMVETITPAYESAEESYTSQYQRHVPRGYAYKQFCYYDEKYNEPTRVYRGSDAANKFLIELSELLEYCRKIQKDNFSKPMLMTKVNWEYFNKAKKCWICDKEYTEEDCGKDKYKRSKKVRDHCHITDKYRGFAHRDCNLKTKITRTIPLVFHNLKGYDSHFIMQAIG